MIFQNLAKWKGRTFILKDLLREFTSRLRLLYLNHQNKVHHLYIDVEVSGKDNQLVDVKLFVTDVQFAVLSMSKFFDHKWLVGGMFKMINDYLPKCAQLGLKVINATIPKVKPYPGSIWFCNLNKFCIDSLICFLCKI